MTSNSEVKVGLLAVVCVVCGFLASVFLGELAIFGEKNYELNVMFSTVGGLKTKAAVMFAEGVSIGKVHSITLNGEKAKVTLRIRQKVRIRSNAEFMITTVGFMGEKYINVSGGTADASFLEPGVTVSGNEPESADKAIAKLSSVSSDFSRALKSLNEILGKKEFQDNIFSTVQDARDTAGEIRGMIEDAKPKIGSSIDTLNKVLNDLTQLTSELRELVSKENRDNVQSTVTRLNQVSVRLESTIISLDNVAKKVENGEGPVGLLLTDKKMAEDLKELVEDLKAHPWKLLWRR